MDITREAEGETSSKQLTQPSGAPKTSQRLRYLAEVEVLKRNLGGLEEVRGQMGLSRRKMCQLLLVDPSAWTRWTRDESKVPPHIWKMLSLLKDRKADADLTNEVLLAPIHKELERMRKKVVFMGLIAVVAIIVSVIGMFLNGIEV